MYVFRCVALLGLAAAVRRSRSSVEGKASDQFDGSCPPKPFRRSPAFFKARPFSGPTCETLSPTVKDSLDNMLSGIRALLKKRTQLQELNRPKMNDFETRWNTSALTTWELAKDKEAVDAGFRPYGGSYNYPGNVWMGSVFQPITRMTPGGRMTSAATDAKTVAETVMHRGGNERVCSDSVNVWFAAWIQLQTEDWVRGLMRGEAGQHGPNLVTSWWDMDSTYGTGFQAVDAVRLHKDGLIDADRAASRPDIGQWVGINALQHMFAKEHNLIAKQLKAKYPEMAGNDAELFGTARLINVATVARIHTLHWTKVLLQADASQVGQTTLWDGVVSGITGMPPALAKAVANLMFLLDRNTAKGIVGGTTQRSFDFAWPEEFSMVYRLHPMLPDSLKINGKEMSWDKLAKPAHTYGYENVAGAMTNGLACALTLQNFPDALTNLTMATGGPAIDLAELDILATRNRHMGSFNDFRRGLHLDPATSFEDLVTDGAPPTARDRRLIAALSKVYTEVEDVDAVVGMLAEPRLPKSLLGLGQYLVFVMMTQTRLESDPFFTEKFNRRHYTKFGLDWIKRRTFAAMLRDHYNQEFASDHEWAGFMTPGWTP